MGEAIIMNASRFEVTKWSGLDLPFQGRPRRPKLLTALGWFIILATIAVVTGTVLGFIG
jgi:hypothetical protein